MSACCIIYSTHPSAEQARETAQALITQHLAACCNILPGIESHYRWEGKLTRDTEVAMISKTTQEQVSAATARIRELHPYDTPAIVSLPVEAGYPPFLAWIAAECAKA